MRRSIRFRLAALAAVWMIWALLPARGLAASDLGKIMPLGDSITAGRNMTGNTPGAYRDPLYARLIKGGYSLLFVGANATYPTEALTQAGQAHHEGHSGYVINDGSAKHEGLADNLPVWLGPKGADPDIILLMIGTNDIIRDNKRDEAPARVGQLISQICDKSTGLKPKARLIVAGITPMKDATKDAWVVAYNQGVAKVVDEHQRLGEHVSFVNMHDALNVDTDMADLLHPNLSGYQKMADVWYDALRSQAAPVAQSSGPRTESLGDFEKGADNWELSLGKEYAGAKGDSQQDATTAHSGKASLRLTGDFGAGGRYVAITKKLDPALELAALRFWVKAESVATMSLRLTDATGQTHQQYIKLEPKADWQEIMVKRFTGPISWGGAGDKQWHGPATAVSLMVEAGGVTGGGKTGTIWVDDLSADVTGSVSQAALAQAAAEAQPPKVDAKLELDRPLPYFWGKQDAPAKAMLVVNSSSSKESAVTSVHLLNYKEEVVAELWKGDRVAQAEKPFRQEISLALPAYGVYYVETDVARAKQPVRTSLAWVAEAAPTWPQSPWGVQMHFVQGPWGSHDKLGGAGPALELVQRMGASWIRDEGDGQLKDTKNPFAYDAPRAKLGLSEYNAIVRYIDKMPPVTPEARAEYCRMAREVVLAKGPDVTCYEVWNEPNIAPGWKGRKPSAREYTDLLKDAYTAIKAANPKATVIGVCTSGIDYAFIEEVLKLDGAKYMDGIAVHPYHPGAPELISKRDQASVGTGYSGGVPFTFLGRVERLKALLDKYNAGHLKVWLSELGYGTFASSDEAASFSGIEAGRYDVRQLLQAMSLPYVERSFIYSFQDRALMGRPDQWDFHHGIIEVSGAPKPCYVALNTMARKLYHTHFAKAHPMGEGAFCYEFAGEGGPVFAAWTVRGAATLTLDAESAGATVTDLMGNDRAVKPMGGRISVAITEDPTFVAGAKTVSGSPALVSIAGDFSGTSEGIFILNLSADSGLSRGSWTTVAPPGWKSAVEGNRLTLTPPLGGATGEYPLIVCSDQMSAGVTLKLSNSVVVTSIADATGVKVTLENPFPTARTILFKPRAEGGASSEKTLTLPAHGKVTELVALQTETPDGWVAVPISLNLSLAEGQKGSLQYAPGSSDRTAAGVTPCYRMSAKPADGDLNVWTALKPCLLANARHWVSASTQAYSGPSDLSVRFWTGWDDTNFYLAAEVIDDKHVQKEKGPDLWRGDSLQFALAVDGQSFAFDVAACEDGSTGLWERISKVGVPADVSAVAKVDGPQTRYEIAIPWKHMRVSAPETTPMKFTLLVNDNDGNGRKGWLEWFSGLGSGKDPTKYGPLLLKH